MFEKEAEEMAEAWLDERYLKDMGVRKPCKKVFLAGVEFGYNKANEQLTKAKEIIKKLVNEFYYLCELYNFATDYECLAEAEQFLREVEK